MRGAGFSPAGGLSAKLLAAPLFSPMLEPTPLYGGNAEFLDALYEQYLRDPGSVEEHWREYFAQLASAAAGERAHGPIRAGIVAARGAGARRRLQVPAPAVAMRARRPSRASSRCGSTAGT